MIYILFFLFSRRGQAAKARGISDVSNIHKGKGTNTKVRCSLFVQCGVIV
jgi:hypothetical protein